MGWRRTLGAFPVHRGAIRPGRRTLSGRCARASPLGVRFVHSDSDAILGTLNALTATATPDAPEPVDATLRDPADKPAEAVGGNKRSLLSSAVYSLGFTVQRAIGLLLLPVYTSVLSPSEYGTLGLLMSAYVGMGMLFSLALDTIIVRNYFQLASDPDERQRFVDAVWRFLVLFPVGAALVVALVAWPFLGHARYVEPVDVGLTLLAAAVNAAATSIPLAILRARQDLRGYLWMTGVLAVGTTGLTLLFVVALDQGVRGWFLATLLGNIALLVTAFVVVPWNRRGRMDWRIVWAAVAFSLPLLPHSVSHWALQLADRVVIAGIVTRSDLGIYTLAANLSSVLMMLVMALNQGFAPLYAQAGAQSGLEHKLRDTVVLQIALVVALTLGLSLLGPPLVEVMASDAFHDSAALVPWLALGYGFLGVYFVPMNGATLGAGRRQLAWVATAISAATNIALLLIFVPKFGLQAAAISSAVAYFVLLLLLSFWAHAGANPVTYDWPRIVPTVALAAGIYALSSVVAEPSNTVVALLVQGTFFLAFVGLAGGWLFRARLVSRARRLLSA